MIGNYMTFIFIIKGIIKAEKKVLPKLKSKAVAWTYYVLKLAFLQRKFHNVELKRLL